MKNQPHSSIRRFLSSDPARAIFSTVILLGITAAAWGDTNVVNFGGTAGGDYVTASQPLQTGSTATNGNTLTYEYSDTSPKSPSSGYTAPSGESGTFYGAFDSTYVGGTPTFGTYSLTNNTASSVPADRITIAGDSGSGNSIDGLIFFEKSDFLNGANSATSTLTLDSGSSLVVNIASINSTGTHDLRVAVYAEVNGVFNWYLSSQSSSGHSAVPVTLSSLDTTDWALYNVSSSSALPAVPTSFTTLGSSFTDIQDAGLYFNGSTTSSAPTFAVSGISFNGDVVATVPEPNTLLLLLFGLAAAVLYSRVLSPARRAKIS